MSDEEIKREKNKNRLGVFLLCFIMILSGVILIKDQNTSGEIKENVSQKQSTNASNESVKSSTDNSSQQSSNVKIGNKININKASIEELDTLPGIGEKTAQKIIDYRKTNGPFKTIEEIKEVSGIGDAKYNQIKSLISI